MTRITLYANTRRAIDVLGCLRELAPNAAISVLSFGEIGGEPRYFDDLRESAIENDAAWLLPGDSPPPTDLIICSNWRRKLPPKLYEEIPLRAFVIHDSLLPKLRGYSPLVHAIRNGETHVGATMFRMTDQIDAGPIVAQQSFSLSENGTIADAIPLMTECYLKILRRTIPFVLDGWDLPAYEQNHKEATLAPQIDWERDTEINRQWRAHAIRNHIRAFQPPYPRAWVSIDGRGQFAIRSYDHFLEIIEGK